MLLADGGSAPAWVSYASPAVALLALAVSLATYRRAGPKIRIKFPHTVVRLAANAPLDIRNAGLAPIDIVALRLRLFNRSGPTLRELPLAAESTRVPVRLEGGSGIVFQVQLDELHTMIRTSSRRRKPASIVVDLGNGAQVNHPVIASMVMTRQKKKRR